MIIKVRMSKHCVKMVQIRSNSDRYFPAFGLNTERYSVSLGIQSKCGKMQTRITWNMGNFCAVKCKMYKEFKNPRMPCNFYKTLLLFSICNWCGSENEKVFKEEESIEILKIVGLIINIEDIIII